MKRKTPTAVTTAVLTLITVVFWAGFEVFRAITVKPTTSVPQEIVEPLDPNLDNNLLKSISGRLFLQDSDIEKVGPISVGTPNPTPNASNLPTVIFNPSPNPSSSPSASPSATGSPLP